MCSRLNLIVSTILFCIISTQTSGLEVNNAGEPWLDPAYAGRIIMVGFIDRHIDRIQAVTSSASYRRRGSYQSSTWSRNISSDIADKYGLVKLTEWPMSEVGMQCVLYLLPEESSVEKTIASLMQDERIDIAQRMNQFQTEGKGYNDPYYQLQTNMQLLEIEQAHNSATGKNITIAVIDTGVDLEHPDLVGQVELNQNFVSSISSGFADDLHGTAVTGIIAAHKDNQTGIIGVAPDVRIVALKACWPVQSDSFEATCNSFTLALAVNTAIKLGVDILNMSLAGPEDPLLMQLLKKARERGIVVVAADPGEKVPNQRFPASMSEVIAVQSLRDESLGQALEERVITAPGDNILTTLPYGTYDFVSGSSLAAAQVSGIVALMLELNADLNLEQIKALIQESVMLPVNEDNRPQIASLNAGKILLALCKIKPCPLH